jgi:hypothetical protein
MTCPCHEPGVFGHLDPECPLTCIPGYVGYTPGGACSSLPCWDAHTASLAAGKRRARRRQVTAIARLAAIAGGGAPDAA